MTPKATKPSAGPKPSAAAPPEPEMTSGEWERRHGGTGGWLEPAPALIDGDGLHLDVWFWLGAAIGLELAVRRERRRRRKLEDAAIDYLHAQASLADIQARRATVALAADQPTGRYAR